MMAGSCGCPVDVPIAKGGGAISATDFFLQITIPGIGR